MSVPALEVTQIGRRFGGLVALRDVSFSVREGEVMGLIGPNGAGKSTLFEIVSGNLPPTTGTIRYFGTDCTQLPVHRRRRSGLCRTFQKVRLFASMTVRENIAVAARQSMPAGQDWRDAVGQVLDRLRLSAQAERMPAEITLADRKKVEIGRAIVGHCRVLLLDESLSGLTHDEAEELIGEIMALSRANGITVVVVEHVLSVLAAMVERLVVLHNATVIADGTPSEIARDPHVIEAYLGTRQSAFAMTALAVANLTVSYGDVVAVRDVSFAFDAGEVFVLLGANGAGKTSILRCISGLVPARSGTTVSGERSLNGLSPHQVARAGISHVPEGRRIFPNLTVEENLTVSFIPAWQRQGYGARSGLQAVPAACRTATPVRRHVVRRRAADAGDRPRTDELAGVADAGRTVARAFAGAGGPCVRASGGDQCAGNHNPVGRAERDVPGTGDARRHPAERQGAAGRRPRRATGFGLRPAGLSGDLTEQWNRGRNNHAGITSGKSCCADDGGGDSWASAQAARMNRTW